MRQELSEDSISLKEEETSTENSEAENEVDCNEADSLSCAASLIKTEVEVDQSACENYYDACDAFSVRSCSPEFEALTTDTDETGKDIKQIDKDDCLLTRVVPKGERENDEGMILENSDNYHPPEKFNKFTCELSIDFVQKRRHPNQVSDRAICLHEQNKSEQNLTVVDDTESPAYSLEGEKSLVMFKKLNKCLEIKITKVDQRESPGRNFHQKMVVEFVGSKMNPEETSDTSVNLSAEVEEPEKESEESPERSDEESGIALDRNESLDSKSEICMIKSSADQEEQHQVNEEQTDDHRVEVDVFTPRTVWDDATDGLEGSRDPVEICESPPVDEDDDENKEPLKEEFPSAPEAVGKNMIIQLEDKKSETTEQFMKNKCNIEMLTEDSIKNLKIYQDSLRYEKNLQFLNSKIDEKCPESDDETLKEKPSAILIQTDQAKVAVIRYQ